MIALIIRSHIALYCSLTSDSPWHNSSGTTSVLTWVLRFFWRIIGVTHSDQTSLFRIKIPQTLLAHRNPLAAYLWVQIFSISRPSLLRHSVALLSHYPHLCRGSAYQSFWGNHLFWFWCFWDVSWSSYLFMCSRRKWLRNVSRVPPGRSLTF